MFAPVSVQREESREQGAESSLVLSCLGKQPVLGGTQLELDTLGNSLSGWHLMLHLIVTIWQFRFSWLAVHLVRLQQFLVVMKR